MLPIAVLRYVNVRIIWALNRVTRGPPQVGGLGDDRGCLTDGFFLVGAGGWSPTLFIRLSTKTWSVK